MVLTKVAVLWYKTPFSFVCEKQSLEGIYCLHNLDKSNKSLPIYRGADKSLAWPDRKEQLKVRHFSSDAEITAAAETRLDGQPSELFLSGLQKLEFGRRSLFPYWSG